MQYAFNLFSHNSPMTENGYNEEEMKMVKETKKIWGNDDVSITATCIRVPIMRAHAESINLEFDRDVSEEEVRHGHPSQSCAHMLHSTVKSSVSPAVIITVGQAQHLIHVPSTLQEGVWSFVSIANRGVLMH